MQRRHHLAAPDASILTRQLHGHSPSATAQLGNYVGIEEYAVTSSVELPVGAVTLRYEFERTGPPDFAAGKGSPGIGRLYVDGSKVAEEDIPVTVPLAFALSGEGLCVGWDSLSPASSAYDNEFPFSGTIRPSLWWYMRISSKKSSKWLNTLNLPVLMRSIISKTPASSPLEPSSNVAFSESMFTPSSSY